MSRTMTVACVQIAAGADTDGNLARLDELIDEAAGRSAQLIGLPEYATCYGMIDGRLEVGAQPEETHPALAHLTGAAQRTSTWLLVGSLAIARPDGRIFNRTYLLGPDGTVRARYDKIHLFDVDLAGGESYRESATIAPGGRAVIADLGTCRLGLSICYDLRFPQIYAALAKAGADILTIPAAFTRKTGRAHWHVLARARAIETGAFVFAPCQTGEQADGRLARFGHSLIVSPWGEILAEAGEEEGVITAALDLDAVSAARRMIPALQHGRAFTIAEIA